MKFSNTYRVRSSEISPKFLLKQYYISMYFQECFSEYTLARKASGFHICDLGLTWLTCDGKAEFYAPMPFWRSAVDVNCWVFKRTPVRLYVAYEASSEGTLLARAESVQLVADLKNHRPQKIDTVADKFELDPERPFPDENYSKIEMFDNGCCASEGMNMISQTVRFDDLDFNMHLNNVRYIPRGLEAIDINYRLSHKLKGYRMKYEREAKFGDLIESIVTKRGDDFSHTLRRASDGQELCRMFSHWTTA